MGTKEKKGGIGMAN